MVRCGNNLPAFSIALLLLVIAFEQPSGAEPISEQVRQQRREAAHRPRRLVFHSDGISMDPQYSRILEPNECVFPYLPGTQTDACTYSLIHQFPVVRLYRSKVGQEWPPGNIAEQFGDGPDGLTQYIAFCRKHGYDAIWAMRTNDTHDAGDDAHGLQRWNSNSWKQAHPELLVGSRENRPPYAGWSAFDYGRAEVREKVLDVLKEVSENYSVDGILLDFFRHLPTFKSTAWGAEASDGERAAMTELIGRTRQMMDEVAAKRGQPLLLMVRTPDSLEYCRALGLDVEQWMKDGLIDIWIVTGYFQAQEWENSVAIGHRYDVPVWASIDESRVEGRENRNSLEAYRAKIMNAWLAGVDAIWMFNFFYYPKDPQFQLLREAGDPKTLAFTDKVYVAEDRVRKYARSYLAGGEKFVRIPKTFAPSTPEPLKSGQKRVVELRVGDDVLSAPENGFVAEVTIQLQTGESRHAQNADDLQIELNGTRLQQPKPRNDWLDFSVASTLLKKGVNQVAISRTNADSDNMLLKDLQLSIKYRAQANSKE